MRWRKWNLRKAAVIVAGILLLLLFVTWIHTSTAIAHEGVPMDSLVAPTVATTPTVDATTTTLNKEKLQHDNDWLWSNGATIITSLVSTLTLAAAGIFTVIRYFNDRKDAREKQEAEAMRLAQERKDEREKRDEEQERWLKDQAAEREKRDQERFQTVVDGLSSKEEPKKVGAAIMLRTFLREGYEQFYTQTFDLAVAHLRLHRDVSNPPKNPDDPLPITTLSYALIAAFKEVYPRIRNSVVGDTEKSAQTLDATGVQLDCGYLANADLKGIWMPNASLRGANLERVNFTGATLTNTDFRKAMFSFTIFTEANLDGANLSGIYPSRSVVFRFATLRNADLHDANLSRNVVFYNAVLSGANLARAILTGANLTIADFSGADLTGADLSNAIFQDRTAGLTVQGTRFQRTDLSEADFSGVNMAGVYLNDAILRGTKMHNVQGLAMEQIEDYRARGAFIDDATIANATRPPASPQSQSNGPAAPSVAPASTDRSSSASSEPSTQP